jgi:anti-sigma regulatory factor (Ser/Thr protein kinase)
MTAPAETDHSGGHVLAQETFRPDPESFAPIRAFVDKWAREVGLGEEQTYRMKLAVLEASANAMDHPQKKGDITLWAWRHLDRFSVDVSHPGEFRVKTEQERGHRGMGLPLMVASADEVSFACLPEGGTRVSLSVFLK